ncbi:MAG: aminoacyl-tRNA hydrolase [Treponemataceae bacterium]|nr:MAG: aminoacyl-tRNA hydrolase [Treponemataceae bacterium]
MIALFVFLGNIGDRYAGNRHNAAWQFADYVPEIASLTWKKKFHGVYAAREGEVCGDPGGQNHFFQNRFFLMPHTFMNNSGESVAEIARFYKIEPSQILVAHDELELPLGAVSLKRAGGLGGHNGLRSIESALGSRDFWRLRFGIGRPQHNDIAGYVLSDFLPGERETLRQIFASGKELFELLLRQEPELLLSEWGKKKISPIISLA